MYDEKKAIWILLFLREKAALTCPKLEPCQRYL